MGGRGLNVCVVVCACISKEETNLGSPMSSRDWDLEYLVNFLKGK